MKDARFDELIRALSGVALPRRLVAGGMVVAVAAVAFSGEERDTVARRRGRRRRRRSVVCFKGRELAVRGAAARELLERGGQRGRCRPQGELPGGIETCQNPLPPCNANPTSCGGAGANCVCFLTTSGDAFCALDQFVCDADESTCELDVDCVDRFGAGFACVSTAGCATHNCGGNGNACAPACQG